MKGKKIVQLFQRDDGYLNVSKFPEEDRIQSWLSVSALVVVTLQNKGRMKLASFIICLCRRS